MKNKSLVVLSDTHCGHRAGLTPPSYTDKNGETRELWNPYSPYFKQQRKMWEWFVKNLPKKIDICVLNGDAIEGKGYRSGGTELIMSDRNTQARICNEILKRVKAKEYYIVYGTPYHVGQDEDFEENIGRDINVVKYSSHLFLQVNNTTFDIKHKIGAAGLPHTRYNSIGKAQLWNSMWAERSGQKKADILIRSHVHYFKFAGDSQGLGIITPCLKGFGDKYGERQCEGLIDIGFLSFRIEKKEYDWSYNIMEYDLSENANIITTRLK